MLLQHIVTLIFCAIEIRLLTFLKWVSWEEFRPGGMIANRGISGTRTITEKCRMLTQKCWYVVYLSLVSELRYHEAKRYVPPRWWHSDAGIDYVLPPIECVWNGDARISPSSEREIIRKLDRQTDGCTDERIATSLHPLYPEYNDLDHRNANSSPAPNHI